MDDFDIEDLKIRYISLVDVLNLIKKGVENLSEEVKNLPFFEYKYDKSEKNYERDLLLEDQTRVLKIREIIDRLEDIDKLYKHTPWSMEQIYANLNRIPNYKISVNVFVNPEDVEQKIIDCKNNSPFYDDRKQTWEAACNKVLKEVSMVPLIDPFNIYAEKEEKFGEK